MLNKIDKFADHLALAGNVSSNFKNETYLDYADKTFNSLMDMGIQRKDGSIRDPFENHNIGYSGKKLELYYYHAEARFCGALGQLIRAGRALEYADCLFLSYSHLLNILAYDFEPDLYAEFWIKELVFAYQGLKAINYPGLDRDIWEKITWRKYGFHYTHNYSNCIAYALASESYKIAAGLGGDENFFDAWAPVLFDSFNPDTGMYLEHGAPMAYDMITKQQMLFAIMNGAKGEHVKKAEELCERGAVSSLYMQSVTGQMPFGGRTNQFLCVESLLSCFFEDMCNIQNSRGNSKAAGVFRRAAENAVASIEPWLRMNPYRHTRQGFEPSMGHGVDSGGIYTVYGLLSASALGTAYFKAVPNTKIQCYETPAETGGYVFKTDEGFHKVFAACGGYHIEIDTCADPEKDATGLGRLHKKGVFPESAISGPCAAEPTYSYAVYDIEPCACTIGPAWTDKNGESVSLAEYDTARIRSCVNVMKESTEGVVFSIIYTLDDEQIEEIYQLDKDGLLYNIKGNQPGLHINVPVIETDGMLKGIAVKTNDGIENHYRNSIFSIICDNIRQTGRSCVNRNGIYDIAVTVDHMVRFQLKRVI